MLVALDTETRQFTPDCIVPPITCVQIATDTGCRIFHHSEAHKWIDGILRDDSIQIVGHTIAFDMAVIAQEWPAFMPLIFAAYEADRIRDVALDAKLLMIALGRNHKGVRYNLEAVVKRWVPHLAQHVNKADEWRKRYGELRDVGVDQWPQEARYYAWWDGRVAYDAAVAIQAAAYEAPLDNILADSYRQARADWFLRLTSNHGILTDRTRVDAFESRLRTAYHDTGSMLVQHGLAKRNKDGSISRRTEPAKARMVQVSKGELALTKGGDVSLSHELLIDTGDPLLIAYSELAALQKKLGTDVPMLREGTIRRLHTRFDALKETGRIGSKAPNLTNLDRKSGVRECFVPPPGHVFIGADYGKGELCTWAQICLWLFGYSAMADALNNGIDPHSRIAARILSMAYEDVMRNKNETYVDDARQAGKVGNFGIRGGMGSKRFVDYAWKQYGVKITEQQAKELKRYDREEWPESRMYFKWIEALFGGLRTTSIRHFVSNRWRGNLGYTQACNSPFQGLLADAGKDAGFHIAKAQWVTTSSALYGCRTVNFPHDEFYAECPDTDQSHFAALELSAIMRERASKWMPNVVPSADAFVTRRQSKRAKPMYDERKMLVAWDG